MKKSREGLLILAVALAMAVVGCSSRELAREASEDEKHPKIASGNGFKKGHGVFLTEATQGTLAVQTAEPVERPLTRHIEAVARVYAPGKAVAVIDARTAGTLAVDNTVKLGATDKAITVGKLVSFDRQLEPSLAQVEALIEFSDPEGKLTTGASVPVTLTTAPATADVAIPKSSVLQTGEGSFVFVANGNHFLRSHVQLGAEQDGWVQVTDGLLAGDVLVTNGVQGLWCLELQATKGGAACCPAPLRK